MPATSLAEQLHKLTVPQTSIYKDDKKRASLLFDSKEAALKDRDTFYEIGLSGLKELIALHEGFRVFEDTLYSVSSKDFERAVQSKEVNKNLDKTIEKFLLQLSPYFLLQSAHKALEWLVNRYLIHEYNQDVVMALILPYHETKIFVRFIQLFNIIDNSNRWNWLQSVQKHGIPLTKQVLHNQCVSNTATLQFICDMTLKYINEFGERAAQLNTVFAFVCSTAVGTMNTSNHITESMITILLPTIVNGLTSKIVDFRSTSYVILGFLITKSTLKHKTLTEIMDTLLSTDFELSYDSVLLINLIYTHQTHHKKMTDGILSNFTASVMDTICLYLNKFVDHKISISAFVMAFLSSVLPLILKDMEEFRKFNRLPEILIDEVDLKNQQPEKIFKCILNAFCHQKEKSDETKEDNESDVEIIEEDDDKILHWYSTFLRNIEHKYPEAFDKVIKKEISSDSKISDKRRLQLSKVLGFKPSISHKIGGTYLFENLNHVNPELRIEAVNYIIKEFHSLKSENIDFVKDSIVNRFSDENVEVVQTALDIPNEYLLEALNEIDLTNSFATIVSKGSKKWKTVIQKAITKFCSLDLLPVNQVTIMAVVPLLFPRDSKSAEISWVVITSPWGKKLGLSTTLSKVNDSMKDNPEVLKQAVFQVLFVDRALSFNDKLDLNLVNRDNTLDIFMYMLLKSCSFNQVSLEEIVSVLDVLLESILNRVIVFSTESTMFTGNTIVEFIKVARKDKILFEIMEYILTRIVEDMNIKNISKTWCNVCAAPELVLIRRLYEIFLTGCGIRTYNDHYAKLLQKLLDKLFRSPKDKFDFICNIAFGHILYANNPKDVINPELQLRSLKLLSNFFAVQQKATWVYDSDVLILTLLFNLNHPILTIRQCVIDLIADILREESDKKFIYLQLLKELTSHKEELLLDHEQLPEVLKTILTEQTPGNKLFRKNCLLRLTKILISDTPPYIKSALVKILSNVNNANTFSHIVPSLNTIESILNQNETDKKFVLDIYESNLMKSVYNQINENTVSTFSKDQIWNSIEIALKEYRECVIQEDQSRTSPGVLVMKQVDETVFAKFPEHRQNSFVALVTAAGAFSNNPAISSVASRTMKKIHITFQNFKPILEKMLNVVDPITIVPKKKKTAISMLSYQLADTEEWKLGVTLLEYVQSKKKMSVDNSFVNILFQLLNKCLRFEEQSHVEYTKQLILSSLWYYCKKFVDDTNKEQLLAVKGMFDVETVVQCIRGTQNPQTQHHALILLSHAAYMLPEQVLHHTMEIFTFMGSSVLRHDDAYSFQIIMKIIETLIPILVKLDKDVDDYTEKEFQRLQKRVVPVLRIFADVVLHVPEHRRVPLYKKLLETLGPNQFLWVFLALLLETHVAHFTENKKKETSQQRTLADQESPINRLDFGQSILLEFSPEISLENLIKLIVYIKSLPLQKSDDEMEIDVDPGDIFSVNGHTAIQLRHYKYVVVTFMNTCLASSRFIQHSSQASDVKTMENNYKTFIINILTYIQSISKISDEKTAKYWRVMLHHSYDLLDHANNLLSAPMFLNVVKGLLKHTLPTVRRKSMELLNSKIQFSPELFNDIDKELLFSLMPVLLDIVKTIENNDENLNESTSQELELNQQTALLSLKLLTRMLASENPEPFKPILEAVTDYTCNSNISGNVTASIVLCLAELCGNLKAHALGSLRRFMPALIKVLKKQRKVDTPELILLSTVTAISKIVESLPLFLSPYLQKILYEYSILLAKWQTYDQDCSKVSAIVTKLTHIKKKIAGSIPPRVLIPVANETYQLIIEKENYDAIGPVMSVLADSFANVTTADFTALQQDLTTFFLSALQLRSEAVERNIVISVIDRAENEVVNALVCLVLKLSESSFRPFYFKIYDWAIRTNIEGHKDRTITFYRLSSVIADKLKGLFVLFAGHFIKNAAELLDSCNISKTENLYFDSEEKCIALVTYILKTLQIVFLYDSQNFLNKDRFETLMQPVVDQLENSLDGVLNLKKRADDVIIPCVAQFAVATGDDSLWKLLNYQILLKSRHNDPEIRLIALDCLVAMATQLGCNWLPLLAESVPFLAELLEDGDQKIETATKDAIRKLEQILGEPLEKYF